MERVDLVYLWVDGNDEAWLEQKQQALGECGGSLNVQATAKGRWADSQELRYSLRSVEKYMPWVGQIFIVTADQTPAWLNVNHPKIRMVSHRDIMSPHHLPTFNSSAIEMSLYRIEGLSERFIFANDDAFVAKPVGPDFFFTPEGLPIARFARHIPSKESLYLNKIRNAQRLVAQRYGVLYERVPHHNMDSYLRSDVEGCTEEFAAEAEATRGNRFRLEGEFHRSAWLYWALARGRAVEKVVTHYSAASSWGEKVECVLRGRYCSDSREFGLHRGGLKRRLAKYNPTLFCLNDTERTTDEQREQMVALLEQMYPEKCSFEK